MKNYFLKREVLAKWTSYDIIRSKINAEKTIFVSIPKMFTSWIRYYYAWYFFNMNILQSSEFCGKIGQNTGRFEVQIESRDRTFQILQYVFS